MSVNIQKKQLVNIKNQNDILRQKIKERIKISFIVFIGVFSILLLIALFSYNQQDSSWSSANSTNIYYNLLGEFGAYISNIILSFLGFFSYVIPFLLIYLVWVIFFEKVFLFNYKLFLTSIRFIGLIILTISGSFLSQLIFYKISMNMPEGAGGILGQIITNNIYIYLGYFGSLLLGIFFLIIGLAFISGFLWFYLSFQYIKSKFNKNTENDEIEFLETEYLKAKINKINEN